MDNNIEQLNNDIIKLNKTKDLLVDELHTLSNTLYPVRLGLYEPTYKYATIEEYEDILLINRLEQKQIINDNKLLTQDKFAVGGNKAIGNNLVKNMSALMMTSFNTQCENIINKVTYANYVKIQEKIYTIARNISKQGEVLGLELPERLIELKIEEFKIVYDKAKKAQEIAIEKKHQHDILVEQEKSRRTLIKSINDLNDKRDELLLKYSGEITPEIDRIDKLISMYTNRLENEKAGYVYIISNPAFGQDIYKIGVTRRANWEDRINELNSAAVPYNFNIHCVIYSDDAYGLEAALHREFEAQKINKINYKKEYFKVPLNEIERVVLTKYDPNAKFDYGGLSAEYYLNGEFL